MKKVKYLLIIFFILLLNSSVNKNIVSIVNIDINKNVLESNISGYSEQAVRIVALQNVVLYSTYYVGDSHPLTGTAIVEFKITQDDGTITYTQRNIPVAYSCANSSIFSVTNNMARAVGSGFATVIVYPQGYPNLASQTYTVHVYPVISGVSFTNYSSTIYTNESSKFSYSVTPSEVEIKSIQWTSSNTSVATVDQSGNVRGIKPGTSTITLSVTDNRNNTKTASVLVTVKSNLSGVSLTNTVASLTKGGIAKVGFTVTPTNGYYQSATWTSSNTSVATIDNNGNINAKGVGTTTITLTVKKGDGTSDIIRSFSLKVNSNLTGVTLTNTVTPLKKGATNKVGFTVTPTNGYYQSATWTSSNTNIATIDGNGNINAKSVGTTTITLTVNKGDGLSIIRSFDLQVISNLIDVNVFPSSLEININRSRQLSFTLTPSNGYYVSKNWASSNTSIATVDQNGNVTGRGLGSTNIILTINRGAGLANITKTIPVTVTPIKATNVYVTPSSLSMNVGNSTYFTASVYPSDATNKNVTWSSNNTNIASVNQSGRVTANKPGSTKICVKHADLSSSFCSNVNVNPITATSIFYQGEDDIILVPGSTMTINYAIIPSNVTNTNHRLVSSNTDVIHVIDDHTVKAVGKGNSTVRIISGDGIVSKSIYFYVPPSNASGHLVLHISGGNSLDVGATARIFYNVIPSGQTAGTVSYSSGNNSIATVTSDGYITGVRPGNVTISAVSSKGFVGSATITVKPASTGISINNHKTIIKANETLQLYTTFSPSNSSGFSKTWVSSNEEVATVSSTGKVTGIKEGTATITVKNSDGSISNTTNIVVINPIDYVVSRQGDMEMALGESKKIEYDILPAEATPRSFVWKTSNAGVATVSDDGTVTIISPGEAVISVETEDGDVFEVTTVRTAGASHGAVDPDAEGQVDDDPPLPETVDNPKTGLTISIICVIIFMIGLVVFKISGKYFNRIKKI